VALLGSPKPRSIQLPTAVKSLKMCLKAKYSTYSCNHIALTITTCEDSSCTFTDRVSDGTFTTEASLCPDCQSFHTVNRPTRSQSLPTNLFLNRKREALTFVDAGFEDLAGFVPAEENRPAPPSPLTPKKSRIDSRNARRFVFFWLWQVIAISFMSWWVLENTPWDKVIYGLSMGWRFGVQAAVLGTMVWIAWKGFQME
jgi:hypothetical protein